MKIGEEVEGQYQGLLTLFCQACEVPRMLQKFDTLREKYKLEHVYVSDHDSEIGDAEVGLLNKLPVKVTLELKSGVDLPRLQNIRYMICVDLDPRELGLFNLRECDQIKFSKDLFVAAASVASFFRTRPEAFGGDIELTAEDLA